MWTATPTVFGTQIPYARTSHTVHLGIYYGECVECMITDIIMFLEGTLCEM